LRRVLSTLVFLAASLVPSAASAQIVNIQPLLGPEDRPGFSLELSGGMELRTGNVDLFTGKASLLMRYQLGRHRLISTSAGALGIKNDAQYLNNLFSHLRHQVFFFDWFAWETWIQGANNRFTRLRLRLLSGTGPRFDLARLETFRLAIGIHYMLEHETLRSGVNPNESLNELNHRANTYLTLTWDIIEGLSFQETVYVQPKLTNPFADYRVSNEIQLTAKVTKHFGLGTSFQLRYDHAAPGGVEALDTTTMATLTAGF